jgi:hypothetical protein
MNNLEFTKLEKTALDLMTQDSGNFINLEIKEHLKHICIMQRDIDPCGGYIRLSYTIDKNKLSPIKNLPDPYYYIPGISFDHPSLECGGGFALWREDGFLTTLEYYANGNYWSYDANMLPSEITVTALSGISSQTFFCS